MSENLNPVRSMFANWELILYFDGDRAVADLGLAE
jgi:hypothetical protein